MIPAIHGLLPATTELEALFLLYRYTAGSGWTDSTGWTTDNTIEDWFGVDLDVSGVSVLNLISNNLVGDLSGWNSSFLPNLITLNMGTNTLTGDLSGWVFSDAITILWLRSNAFTGDISGWVLPSALTSFQIHANSFSGDITGWSLPAGLTDFYVGGNNVSGNISSFSFPAGLMNIYFSSSSLSGINTPPNDCDLYWFESCGLSQADVDGNINNTYTNRANYTNLTPDMKIGGTNAAPSGTYEYSASPSDPLQKVYALINDDDAEGFNKWTIDYTAP